MKCHTSPQKNTTKNFSEKEEAFTLDIMKKSHAPVDVKEGLNKISRTKAHHFKKTNGECKEYSI